MDLLWLPFSLATIFFYGLGQVFAKETRTNAKSATLLVLLGINILVIWAVYWLIFRDSSAHDSETWIVAIIAAVLSGAAYLTYYEALKHGKVSIVGTIAGAYAPWTVVLALVFLGESLNLREGAGVALVVSSMLLFTYSAGDNGGKRTELLGIAFAACSLFFWGASAALAKNAIEEIGNTDFIGVYALVVPTMWLAFWFATGNRRLELPKSNVRLLEVSFLFLALGGITMYLAIENGNVSIVSPITNLYPIVTIAVAKVRLKESLSRLQITALVFLLVSILLFSI